MMQAIRSFLAGIGNSCVLAARATLIGLLRALRGIKTVILLYLVNLLFAALISVPVYFLVGRTLAPSPDTRAFLTSFDVEFISDLVRNNETLFSAVYKVATVSSVLFVLVHTFLIGGVLAALADRRRPLNFTTFFSSCGRYLFPFLRALLPALLVLAVLLLLNRAASSLLTDLFTDRLERAASATSMGTLLIGKTLLFLVLICLLVGAPLAFARIRCVIDDDRCMTRGYLKGMALSLTNPLAVLLTFAASLLLVVALYAGHDQLLRRIDWGGASHPLAALGLGFDPAISPDLIYLLLAQATILLVQGLVVAKVAGLMLIYEERSVPPDKAAAGVTDPIPGGSPVVDAPGTRRHATRTATLLLLLPLVGSMAPALSAEEPIPKLPSGPFSNEYVIQVELDAQQMALNGTAEILFRNLSDSPVEVVPFHLYPNAWANTGTLWIRDGRREKAIAERGAEGGGYMEIHSVQAAAEDGGEPADLGASTELDGTLMRVTLPRTLGRDDAFRFRIRFTTKLPRIVARMGKLARHVNAMQWFPKLCAHQDGKFIDYPFRNPSEFFADFGSYEVSITVPEEFVLEATGSPRGEPRIEAGNKTVTYEASAVHDFAWCANPHFSRHTTETGRGVEIILLAQPYLEPKAEQILEATRFAMETYDDWIFPYPYPRLVIDSQPYGMGGGMEYPMLFTISMGTPVFLDWMHAHTENPVGVTIHEFSHQYWYGMIASNEFEEAWLDEGFTTYMTYKVMNEFFPTSGAEPAGPGLPLLQLDWVVDPLLDDAPLLTLFAGYHESPFDPTNRNASPHLFGFDMPSVRIRTEAHNRFHARKDSYLPFARISPLKTASWEVYKSGGSDSYRSTAYSKPALMLRTLEGQIGWERMRGLIRSWSRRFAFGHPTSDDFVALADEQLGGAYHDFLVGCIEGSDTIDFSVEEVRSFPVEPAKGFLLADRPGQPPSVDFPPPPESGGILGRLGDLVWRQADEPEPEAGSDDRLFASEVVVRNHGNLWLPTAVELRFEDGSVEEITLTEKQPWYRLTPTPRKARLVAAVVDPRRSIALDLDFTNNGRLARPDTEAARAIGTFHQFWVQSWLSGISWFS